MTGPPPKPGKSALGTRLCNGQVSNYQNAYLIQRVREINKLKNNNELFIPESQCHSFFIPLRNYRIDDKEYSAIMRDFCCLVKF